jgi:hypothetical protein
VRSRALLGSWTRALATAGIVAAILLAGIVAQRMVATPIPRIIRSVQLTFTGQVAAPGIETDLFPALVTDGERVYFTQIIDATRFTLAQASIGGREVVTIPTPLNQALLVNVSSDGSRLLVRDFEYGRLEDPLWVIPTVGGAPLRLGAVVAHDAAWSPDGERLVFARGEELYVARSDGSEPRRIAATPGRAFWLRWSPDAARLRFTVISRQGIARSLWEVSAEGHDLRPLPLGHDEHDLDCCGEWSSDGRHFFFRRFRDNRADIWAIREGSGLFVPAASKPVRLTSGPLHFAAVVRVGTADSYWSSARCRAARTCGSISARANTYRTTREDGPGGSRSREAESGSLTCNTAAWGQLCGAAG